MELLTPKRKTWLYQVNPALKFISFMLMLLVILFTQNVNTACWQMILFLILLYLLSGHGWKRMLLFTAPFLLIFFSSAFALILFGRGETVWWQWGLIKISKESFQHGLLVGFKTLSFGALGLLFGLTTKPVKLFYALMQQLKLSPKYAYSFMAAIRMLPMVMQDFQQRSDALKVRGVQYSRGMRGIYERIKAYSVPLLAQSIRRAQRVATAMEAKRFQMNAARTYYYPLRYSSVDALFVIVMIACAAAFYSLSAFFPIVS